MSRKAKRVNPIEEPPKLIAGDAIVTDTVVLQPIAKPAPSITIDKYEAGKQEILEKLSVESTKTRLNMSVFKESVLEHFNKASNDASSHHENLSESLYNQDQILRSLERANSIIPNTIQEALQSVLKAQDLKFNLMRQRQNRMITVVTFMLLIAIVVFIFLK